jgi:GT2 family glycosyltransferase
MDAPVGIVPVSAVIATCNRNEVLARTLESVWLQTVYPAELIVVDASDGTDTRDVCHRLAHQTKTIVHYNKANEKGAARQREQGIAIAKFEFFLFLDDDIIMDTTCLERMWKAIQASEKAGGVNAMIKNQQYTNPGTLTRIMYQLMSGEKLSTYAGKCIGPAWNLLPQDDERLPEIVKVEWLNTTCTLYKKEALPVPLFDKHFTGYSLMEDLALSLIVAQKWNLYNARTARIFHDSQSGGHKSNVIAISEMELVNRFFVMKHLMHRTGFLYYMKLAIYEVFQVSSLLARASTRKIFLSTVRGKLAALKKI